MVTGKVAGIICTFIFIIGLFHVSAVGIDEDAIPAFASDLRGSMDADSMTSVSFISSLRLRDAALDGTVPAAVEYMVDIKPAGNATAALGTIRTTFTAEIMEANGAIGNMPYYNPASTGWNADYWDNPAAIRSYRDVTSAGGQIYRYSRNFKYTSGVAL